MNAFIRLATIGMIAMFLLQEARAQALPAPAPASSSSPGKPSVKTSGCAPKCLKVNGERVDEPTIDPLKAKQDAKKAVRRKASVNPAANPSLSVAPAARTKRSDPTKQPEAQAQPAGQ
jgi:hypothetical protein